MLKSRCFPMLIINHDIPLYVHYYHNYHPKYRYITGLFSTYYRTYHPNNGNHYPNDFPWLSQFHEFHQNSNWIHQSFDMIAIFYVRFYGNQSWEYYKWINYLALFPIGEQYWFQIYIPHTHIYICIYVCIYIIIILSHNLFPTVFPNDLFPVIMIIQYYPIIFPGSSAPDGCGVTSHPNLAPLAALEMLFSTIGWILKDNVLKNSMGILWDI